jgi:ABC-2 type transport system ATP-binding protein
LAIYEELSAEENLRFFGKMYDVKAGQLAERIDYCLELAGLADRRKSPAKTFSGGMKRRLNLVCSLLHDPAILLLDEPTVGVDPQSRNAIFDSIESLKSKGKTIIYTTHYMEEAERLCDRVAILDHGKILALDTVEHLVAEHGGPSRVEAVMEKAVEDAGRLAKAVDGTGIRCEGNRLVLQTDKPMESLAELNRTGLRFHSLKIDSPNLEDVFLNLTGRTLRD